MDTADGRLRADLLRLLGAVRYQAGHLPQAEAILSGGSRAAAAAGERSVQARIGVLLAEIHAVQGEAKEGALAECEAAAALLDAEGDLAGLAGAWLAIGILPVLLGDAPAAALSFERAAACARQGGVHHEESEATGWLLVSFQQLPIPVSEAIGRAGQLLKTAAGDSWAQATILQPLSLLYGYAGRFADARAAIGRSQAIFTRSGSALNWGTGTMVAGRIELIAGDAAAAERVLTEGRLVADTSAPVMLAHTLVASAEVSRLTGEPEQAEASLRQALRIYQDRGAAPLAARAQAVLASLATRPPTESG